MYTQSIILPFDIEGRIYVLEDENGRIVGTGRREVCVALFQIIDRAKSAGNREPPPQRTPLNVRSAIVIFDDGSTTSR